MAAEKRKMEKIVKWMSGKAAGYIMEFISVWLMGIMTLQLCGLFGFELENTTLLLILMVLLGLIHTAGRIMNQERAGIAVIAAITLILFVLRIFRGYRLVLVPALAGYFLLLLIHRFDWLRRIYVTAAIAASVTAFCMGKEFSKILAGILILLVLKELVSFWGRENGVRMLPFLLAIQLVILLIPTRDKPIDWSFVYRMGESINNFYQIIIMETEYFMENLGFQGEGSGYGNLSGLTGSLVQTDREELYLGSKTTRGNLYLAGREYETLNGQYWEDTARDLIPQYGWFALYMNALYYGGITEAEADCFSRICTSEITFGYLKTQDVIHPSNALQLSAELAMELTGKIGDYTFGESKKKDYSYRIDFMEFDYSNPYLIDLMRKSGQIEQMKWAPYDELDRLCKEIYGKTIASVISRREYYLYQIMFRHVEEETLDISGISPRTQELALSVTEGLDNDFDRAKAIEAYLRQYPYSAETDLREYDDFVEAFLFEEQSGYCIHYASAMVQMLRANGIPARLAQGYCCTYENREKGVKKVTIYGSDAHAWPEAYIRGFGWVRFEPTAVMETAEEYGWNLRVKEVTAADDASSEMAAGAEKEMLMEAIPKPDVTEFEKLEEELQLQKEQERKELIRLLIILPLAALAALLLINMAMKKIRYLRRNGFQRLESNLEDIRWLIRELYPSDWNNRHLLEYAAVLEDPGHREQMEKTVLRYYELRFKGGQLTEEEENKAVSLREALYSEYLRLSGKKYWMQKIRAFFALESGRI